MSRRRDREKPREDWGQLHPASRGRGREGLPHRGRLGCREVDPGWHGSGRKPRGGSEEDRGPEVLSWILREAVCLGAVPESLNNRNRLPGELSADAEGRLGSCKPRYMIPIL